MTDPAGKKRRSRLDGLGRLSRVDEPTGSPGALGATGSPNQATTYSYDALGNLTGVAQGSQTRTFAYDSLSRLTSAGNPESGTTTYGYDNNGNLTRKSDGRGVVITYSYDALDRLTQRSYSYAGTDPAVSLETTRVDYAYDNCVGEPDYSEGRLCSVTAGKGAAVVSKTIYGDYDALGRVGGSTQTTGGVSYRFSYGYDRAGNLVAQTYPSGKVVETVYDGAGRVAGVRRRGGGWYAGGMGADAIGYEAHGGMRELRLGNGLWEQRRYNARLQPTQIGLGRAKTTGALTPTGSGLLLLDYGYGTTGNNGNVASQRIRVGASLDQSQAYTYDALNRLKTATESGSGTGWMQTYSYDRYGNRAVTGTGAYLPAADRTLTPRALTSFDASSNRLTGMVSYDGSGNLAGDWGMRSFKYDGDHRMVDFRVTAGGVLTQVRYRYDGEGRRISKEVVGGRTTTYVYNALGQLAAEYAGRTPAALRYLTADPLGSTRVVTGQDRSVLTRHDYLPFGQEIEPARGNRATVSGYTVSLVDGPAQKFTGKERDAESRLDYFQARYFSGAGGRFTNVDPENAGASPADPQSWNGYAYARNNPLLYVDPDGETYRICQADGTNCAEITNQQYHEQIRRNKAFIVIGGKIYRRDEKGRQGELVGTAEYWGEELDPEVAAALRAAGERAEAEIKQFLYDLATGLVFGAAYGKVVQTAARTVRLLPFKGDRASRIRRTLDDIANGRVNYPRNDGEPFENREALLPVKPYGYYREFTVHPAPGVTNRGTERLVVGRGGEIYYTPKHYDEGTFVRIK